MKDIRIVTEDRSKFLNFKSTSILLVVLLSLLSCQSSEGPIEKVMESEVVDWKSPCDLKNLCEKDDLLSSLNGPLSFRKDLKNLIDKKPKKFQQKYGDEFYYICGQLIAVGGCEIITNDALRISGKQFEYFMHGLAHCHHFNCHEYFQNNKSKLETKIHGSKKSQKYFYLMAIKLPLPWFKKSSYLDKYLFIIDGEIIRYEDLGPLISSIPNHQGIKTFIAKNFHKIDQNLDGVAVYLARYQTGWHDKYYKLFLDTNKQEAISAFILSMRIGCPSEKTILAFKGHLTKENRIVFEETLKQEILDREFKEWKLKTKKDSKCLSSSQPVF